MHVCVLCITTCMHISALYVLTYVCMYCISVLPRLRFCATIAPKLSLWDILRTLIFGVLQDFESIYCVWKISMPKITLFLHCNSRCCNSCFDWCIGFLNCTGISIQWQYILIIIMKMGTCQFAPFRLTNENLFDMRSSAFKMSDSKKQKWT